MQESHDLEIQHINDFQHNLYPPDLKKESSPTERTSTQDKLGAETACSNKKGYTPSKIATSHSGIHMAHSTEFKKLELHSGLKATGEASGIEPPAPSHAPTLPPKDFLMRIGIQKKNRKLFQILNRSTKDCLVCNKGGSLKGVIEKNLHKKYLTTRDAYNVKVINDLVYNENTHLVCVFKDYLIYDDCGEFLKRFYAGHESATRLPKVYDFYDKYSQVFPNYIAIKESKFMFKNIERKQRIIDEQQQNAKKKQTERNSETEQLNEKLLTTKFLEEIDQSNASCICKNYDRTINKKLDKPAINDMKIHELVDVFISKDTLSQIDMSQALKSIDDKPETVELLNDIIVTDPLQGIQNNNPATYSYPGKHNRSKSESKPLEIKPLSRNAPNFNMRTGLTAKDGRKQVWNTPNKKPENTPVLQPQVRQLTINARKNTPNTARYSPIKGLHSIPSRGQSQKVLKTNTASTNNRPSRPPSSQRTTPIPDRIINSRQNGPLFVPASNTITPELNEPAFRPSTFIQSATGTMAYRTNQLPNMKTNVSHKRSTSTTNRERNRAIQIECLHEIYYGGNQIKTGKSVKGTNQKNIISDTIGLHREEIILQQKTTTVRHDSHPLPVKQFKSNYLNQLQQKNHIQNVIPHAMIQYKNQRGSVGENEKKVLANSKSATNLRQNVNSRSKKDLFGSNASRGVLYNGTTVIPYRK